MPVVIAERFDLQKLNVVSPAIGGRGETMR